LESPAAHGRSKMALTPTQALARQAETRPNNTAVIFKGDVWTLSQARRRSRTSCARPCSERRQGDRVALHTTCRPEMVVAYNACFGLGAIAGPLGAAFTFAELALILQRLKPALYIGEGRAHLRQSRGEFSASRSQRLTRGGHLPARRLSALAGERCLLH